jgi:hypothetical protein
MAAFATAVVIASTGDLRMAPGSSISFSVTWGSNISPFRWSRAWASIPSSGDEDSAQKRPHRVERLRVSLLNPASTRIPVTLRGKGQSGAPAVVRIQVLSSQVDTY